MFAHSLDAAAGHRKFVADDGAYADGMWAVGHKMFEVIDGAHAARSKSAAVVDYVAYARLKEGCRMPRSISCRVSFGACI